MPRFCAAIIASLCRWSVTRNMATSIFCVSALYSFTARFAKSWPGGKFMSALIGYVGYARTRVVTLAYALIVRRVGPEVVDLRLEAVDDRRIVLEEDRLGHVVGVRRHRHERVVAVVGRSELDDVLAGEQHHLEVHDAAADSSCTIGMPAFGERVQAVAFSG